MFPYIYKWNMAIGDLFIYEEQEQKQKMCMSEEKRRANLQLLLTFEVNVPEAILSSGIEGISWVAWLLLLLHLIQPCRMHILSLE